MRYYETHLDGGKHKMSCLCSVALTHDEPHQRRITICILEAAEPMSTILNDIVAWERRRYHRLIYNARLC